MESDLSLLLPEWQGAGAPSAVSAGARALAARFPAAEFLEIDAPDAEALSAQDGVTGLDSIAARAARTLDAIQQRRPARILTIGATCGVELAPVSYLNDRYHGDLAVIWFDAHADLNTPATSPSGRFHGMVLRTLLGAGPEPLVKLLPRRLSPEQITLAGARDLDRDEAAFVSDAPIAWLRPSDLLVPDRVAGRVRARGFTKAYVHLDLDVLDPHEFDDVLVPAPGGVAMNVVAETIQHLAGTIDVVGFSVVEFCPRSTGAVRPLHNLITRLGIRIGALGGRPNF